jgi:hypothetical protein
MRFSNDIRMVEYSHTVRTQESKESPSHRLFPINRTTLLLITLPAFSISFLVKAAETAIRILGRESLD